MSTKRTVFLLLCAVLIALCVWQVYRVEPFLQYVVAAPAPESPQDGDENGEKKSAALTPLETLLNQLSTISEGWTGIVSDYAVTGERAGVLFSGVGGASGEARLSGEYGSINALPGRLLSSGRAFYDEELQSGAPVIILDEQLAIALFRVGDPIGRTVTMDEVEYQVVGVARHSRAAGDQEAYGAYVPLMALKEKQLETLTVWGKAVPGAGALSKFKADMTSWQEKGNLYSLSQERERALLPLWLLLTAAGLTLLLFVYRAYGRYVLHLVADYRERLQHRFAVQMTPRLLLYCLLTVLTLAGLLALSYLWARLLLHPVDIFPEWIPAVPVEVDEILSTYWQNVAANNGLTELRSHEVMTLRMWHTILRLLCAFAGMPLLHGLGVLRGRESTRKKQQAKK